MEPTDVIIERIKTTDIRDLLIDVTCTLVAIESHRDAPQREIPCALKIAEILTSWGFAPQIVEVLDGRPNVICRMPGSGTGPSLMFNGHIDTVPDNSMAFPAFMPFLSDGKLHGRGTVDMKGALVCMMVAMKILRDQKVPLAGDVLFTAVINEEDRSEGTEYLVNHGPKADRCVVGEPTSLQIMVGHRGLEWLRFEFIGKAAHGGTPEKGINAISMASKFIHEVEQTLMPSLKQRVHPIIGPAVMNLGVIKGGVQPSTVAERCTLEIDRRWIPAERLDQVLGEYQQIIADLTERYPGFSCRMERIDTNMATMDHYPMEIDVNDPLVRDLHQALMLLQGRKSEPRAFGGWTDASLISNFAHIPCVVFGPGDLSLAHSANEWVEVDELVKCTQVYALLASIFCNHSF